MKKLWVFFLFGLPLRPGAQFQPQITEKFLHQGGAFFLPDAGLYCRMVVKGHGKQAANRVARAEFAVGRAVDHPGNPGIDDGTGAHGTGLQRHIQGTLP